MSLTYNGPNKIFEKKEKIKRKGKVDAKKIVRERETMTKKKKNGNVLIDAHESWIVTFFFFFQYR